MSFLDNIIEFVENLILKKKQTDVSAECEDSIQFEDKYDSITITNNPTYKYLRAHKKTHSN